MQHSGRYAERLGRVRQMMREQRLDALLCYGNPFRKDYLRYVHPAPTPSPYGFCLLTGAAASEIAPGHQDLEITEFRRKLRAQHFEGVLGQLLRIDVNQVAARNDDVGVDIVAELISAALKLHVH